MSDITMDVTMRVTVDAKTLGEHIGQDLSTATVKERRAAIAALYDHIRFPIEDPSFDTPAEFKFWRVEIPEELRPL